MLNWKILQTTELQVTKRSPHNSCFHKSVIWLLYISNSCTENSRYEVGLQPKYLLHTTKLIFANSAGVQTLRATGSNHSYGIPGINHSSHQSQLILQMSPHQTELDTITKPQSMSWRNSPTIPDFTNTWSGKHASVWLVKSCQSALQL